MTKKTKIIIGAVAGFFVLCVVIALIADPTSFKNALNEIDSPSTSIQSQNDNPLLKLEIQKEAVKSGAGDNIGNRGFVTISKAELKNITPEQLKEFTEKNVAQSGFNWFSIVCEDGTGLVFAGSIIEIAEYGKLDTDGRIEQHIGDVKLANGTYQYTSS